MGGRLGPALAPAPAAEKCQAEVLRLGKLVDFLRREREDAVVKSREDAKQQSPAPTEAAGSLHVSAGMLDLINTQQDRITELEAERDSLLKRGLLCTACLEQTGAVGACADSMSCLVAARAGRRKQ